METLRGIRQTYRDTRRGGRGLCLPSLSKSSRCLNILDPSPSPGASPSYQPVPPTHRERRNVVTPSHSSPSLLCVAESSQFSQPVPSLMEPVHCSNTLLQARANILNRLGSQESINECKLLQGPLSALRLRTPKLLAPLERRSRDIAVLSALKHHVPLKPISRSPLCSRTQLRGERLSWNSQHTGLQTTKGGSEESESSSGQSSIDLDSEGEDLYLCLDVFERTSGGSHLESVGERLSKHSNEADFVRHFNIQSKVRHIPPINRPSYKLGKEAASLSTIKAINTDDEGKPINMNHAYSSNAQKGDTTNNTVPFAHMSKEKINYAGQSTEPQTDFSLGTFNTNYDPDDVNASSEGSCRNDPQHIKTTEQIKDSQVENPVSPREGVKLQMTEEKTWSLTSFVADTDPMDDERVSKALKPVHSKEERTSTPHAQKGNTQAKLQTVNVLAHKGQGILNSNQSKTSLKYSLFHTQSKDKTRKNPELIINREVITKVGPKPESVKDAHGYIDSPTLQKTGSGRARGKRSTPEESCRIGAQQQPVIRELKRAGGVGTPRSRYAEDLVPYKDMFQQIQSRDKDPAIYEMFAGPFYDNLRVSSSDDKVKNKQELSAGVIPRPLKQAQSKLRRNSMEKVSVSTKDKPKLASSRGKYHHTSLSRNNKRKMKSKVEENVEVELFFSKDVDSCRNQAQENSKDLTSSTVKESLSVTLKSDDKTLTSAAVSSFHRHMNLQEENRNSSTRNRSIPDPSLSQSPHELNINTWTSSSSSSSSSSSHNVVSPVYQKFLDDVGDGPLTDDLLQCLAEELISLDERDASIGPFPEMLEPSKGKSNRGNDPIAEGNRIPEVNSTISAALFGTALAGGDSISWTKGEILGRGAYGIVYCGLTSQGQLIAVKQVSLDALDPDAAQREYRRLHGEVELLKTLRHGNIVGFLGTTLHQHAVSILMEYIPGGSIASVLRRFGPLPEPVLALYTHQILEGVAYLHLNMVIHRDLKGNNIMLMPTGVIKLIDFGCACRLNHTASNSKDLLKSVHGTPYWMAPEVINDTGYGRKADIWSVGCTVFEMATRKPPLAHMDKMAALFYVGAQRGEMPKLPDGFSDDAKDFVKFCLTSDQRLRPSAEQLLKHSFILQNMTRVQSWTQQKKNCCTKQDCKVNTKLKEHCFSARR